MELNLIKLRDMDLFSPYIVVVAIALYVLLAAVGYAYHIRNLQWASTTTFLYVLWGTLFFIAGALVPKLITRYRAGIKSAFKNRKISEEKNNSWYSKIKILVDERVLLALVLIALFLQGLNLYLLGGLPILSGYIRFNATTDLWRVSYLIFLPALNLLLAKYPRKWYYLLFIAGLGLFAVTGYRTTTIAIILSVFITSYYARRLKTKYILFFILLLAVIGIAVGYIAVITIEWQQWALNPLELLFYRAGFTLMVLDKIVHMPGFTGGELFSQIFSSQHPRVTVGLTALGYKASITSTIFGPAVLDFGALGLAVQMFLLGFILRLMHSTQKIANGAYIALYAVILAHTMIWVETGPTDIIVWTFYALAILSLIIFALHTFRGATSVKS